MTEIKGRDGVDSREYVTATGEAAMAETLSYGGAFQLEEVRIHVGTEATTEEDLTITINAAAGEAYDVLLKTIPMAGVGDYVWAPDRPSLCKAGDAIDFAWTNTDERTWGLTYIYRRIG